MAQQAQSRQGQEPGPQAKGETPKHDIVFREFGGVNVQSPRQSIKDNEFYWLENAQPIGFGNLPVVNAPSGALQTLSGETVLYSMTANVDNIDYAYAFCSSGAGYQVQLTTPFTTTTIGAVGTFSTTLAATQWENSGILITDAVKGYFDWNITTPNSLTVISASTTGTSIASYAGRVWIGNNRTVSFTDVASYNSFSGAGGAFTISDSTLHNDITALVSANSFLYIFGDDSVDALGDVTVSSGVTSFTRTNITASVGSKFPVSIFPFYRALAFANQAGFYSLSGATPLKLSGNLDRLVSAIDFTKPVTGAQVFVNNILCAAYLFTFNDTFTPAATVRPMLAVYFSEKWWFASQGSGLRFLIGAPISGTSTLFAWDTNKLYRLFSSPTDAISSRVQTKLWDGGSPLTMKAIIRAALGITFVEPTDGAAVTATTDNEYGSQPLNAISGSPMITWVNALGGVVQFQNALNQDVDFTVSGYVLETSPATSNNGKYAGMTLTSTTNGINYNLLALQIADGKVW